MPQDGILKRWESDDGRVLLLCGDALEVLPTLDAFEVDGIVTDPPYSSGGAFRSDRTQKTVAKYVKTGAVNTCREEFTGDNRDQRSFAAWSALWSLACHNLTVDGGVLVSFIDWRQLPTLTDAVQAGGWVWRNLCTWHKPGVRHIKGRFSASAEYLVYCSRGVPTEGPKSPCNVFTCPPVRGDDKEHVAEKPVAVLAWALSVVREGGLVLDPFMGSGTAGVASIDNGRRYIGIEKDPGIFDKAAKRIADHLKQGRLFKADDPAPITRQLFGDSEELGDGPISSNGNG